MLFVLLLLETLHHLRLFLVSIIRYCARGLAPTSCVTMTSVPLYPTMGTASRNCTMLGTAGRSLLWFFLVFSSVVLQIQFLVWGVLCSILLFGSWLFIELCSMSVPEFVHWSLVRVSGLACFVLFLHCSPGSVLSLGYSVFYLLVFCY